MQNQICIPCKHVYMFSFVPGILILLKEIYNRIISAQKVIKIKEINNSNAKSNFINKKRNSFKIKMFVNKIYDNKNGKKDFRYAY